MVALARRPAAGSAARGPTPPDPVALFPPSTPAPDAPATPPPIPEAADSGAAARASKASIATTISDLAALLGSMDDDAVRAEEAEREKRRKEAAAEAAGVERPKPSADGASRLGQEGPGVGVEDSVLRKIAEAETARERARGGGAAPSSSGDDASRAREIETQMEGIVRRARELAERAERSRDAAASAEAGGAADDAELKAKEEALRREFEGLVSSLGTESRVPRDDVRRVREAAFRQAEFWVTDVVTVEEAGSPDLVVQFGPGAWVIRGNLRADQSRVFADLVAASERLFGDRLACFVVPDPGKGGEPPASLDGRPRPAFVVTARSSVAPEEAPAWQWGVAAVLLLLAAGTCFQLGVVANVARLPPEALDALADPGSFAPDTPLPGMTDDALLAYVAAALPIAGGALSVSLAHELGHAVAAAARGVKIGPSFLLPNGQIGTFGAITPLRSLVPTLDDLWDVAAAGPAAGGLAAVVLVLYGLVLTGDATAAAGAAAAAGDAAGAAAALAALVPVPAPLFQGSVLLGGLAHLALGDAVFNGGVVPLHPLVVAGWCGLVATAFNLLPVGRLDGGRMAQAALGRPGLALTSLFTYVGLALGLLGSSLALPFGLAVLVLQRDPENAVLDQVTPAADGKRAATAAAVGLALLVLLPVAPELSGGVSPAAGGGSFHWLQWAMAALPTL